MKEVRLSVVLYAVGAAGILIFAALYVPQSRAPAAHFGFPSAQQMQELLKENFTVQTSGTYYTGFLFAGLYWIKMEQTVTYQGSAYVLVIEYECNNTLSATGAYSSQLSQYMPRTGTPSSILTPTGSSSVLNLSYDGAGYSVFPTYRWGSNALLSTPYVYGLAVFHKMNYWAWIGLSVPGNTSLTTGMVENATLPVIVSMS